MELKEYQENILNLLIEHEEEIGKLYAVFAEKFQDYNQFWLELSKQEENHALWIEKLSEMIKKGEVFFDQKRFNLEAIRNSLAELQKDIIENKHSDIPLIKALSVAYYYETALIERKFFEVFETDSAELKHTLISLSEETIKHQKQIKEALDKEKVKNDTV